MLGHIEQFLTGALSSQLPQSDASTLVLAAAAEPPADTIVPCLCVQARALRMPPNLDGSLQRQPARAVRELALSPDLGADPTGRSFTLPQSGADQPPAEISEAYTDDWRQLRPGDAYLVDGAAIRCFRHPGGRLHLRLLGARTGGYVEHGPCEIDLVLAAWGLPEARWEQEVESADDLLGWGIAGSLASFARRDIFDLAADPTQGFSLRLRRPLLQLVSVGREVASRDNHPALCAQAALVLRGEMELTLLQGAPEPPDEVIRQVVLDLLTIARATNAAGEEGS